MVIRQTSKQPVYSQQKQDQELTVAQIMNSLLPNSDLKKVGKTTRPFRYDLNQIPYDYTVEVRNRFKGLDLIDRVSDKLWTEVHDIVQEAGIKTIPKKRKCKKEKWLSEEALQVAEKRREARGIKISEWVACLPHEIFPTQRLNPHLFHLPCTGRWVLYH